MAKKKKKSYKSNKLKISRKEQAKAVVEFYGAEIDESNIASVQAVLQQSAHGKYKDDTTGRDIGRAYLTQRTRGEFFRDWAAAEALAGYELTEESFIRNIEEYDERIDAEIERIKRENPGASSDELSHLVGVQVFGSPD